VHGPLLALSGAGQLTGQNGDKPKFKLTHACPGTRSAAFRSFSGEQKQHNAITLVLHCCASFPFHRSMSTLRN